MHSSKRAWLNRCSTKEDLPGNAGNSCCWSHKIFLMKDNGMMRKMRWITSKVIPSHSLFFNSSTNWLNRINTPKGRLLIWSLAATLALPVLGHAAVKGFCSSCHTIHNSEEGAAVAYTLDNAGQQVFSTQPLAKLLRTDCLGCHSHSGAETIISTGETVTPVVFNLIEPTYPPDGSTTSTLAGGNFHWLIKSGDAYGHNVYGIAAADSRFSSSQAPGGEEQPGECVTCHATLATAESGCEGCHVPHHHAAKKDIVVDREKGWYRFLGSVMQHDDQVGPPPEGVIGIEAPDWEQNPLIDRHNSYQGSPGPYASYLDSGSISQKCIGCHGQFHSDTVANSTWIRHPVEVAIPDAGEFTGFAIYNPLVPVARQNISSTDANFSAIDRGTDLVSCISCHRAHGSPYPAMLRWAYRDWPGIDQHTQQPAINGCAVCHTSKN